MDGEVDTEVDTIERYWLLVAIGYRLLVMGDNSLAGPKPGKAQSG